MANEAFPTFEAFMQSVQGAKHEQFAARESANVKGPDEFEAMRQHVIDLYDGVEVQHSFVDDDGQVFDCAPVEQQPSMKGESGPPATAPDAPGADQSSAEEAQTLAVRPNLQPSRADKFGHSMVCPPGTIPMRRVTLDELSRGENLRRFFQKSPLGGNHPGPIGEADAGGVKPVVSGVHKYAHAAQQVDNLGGQSILNLWAPGVGSQIFSLSQQWWVGFNPTQTVEFGWQVYPAKYHTNSPCLFIYWTADGYQHTGNYNLDAPAFVQTNPNWALGGAVGPLSAYGGAQYDLMLGAFLSGGNWWLYAGGGAASNAVGYYRASQYGSGPLAAHGQYIDFGGEVVDQTAWPPMGSGRFAADGWTFAAFQRDIRYYPTAGGNVAANLGASQPSPNCFTIQLQSTSAPWNSYFWFGGPGGAGCT